MDTVVQDVREACSIQAFAIQGAATRFDDVSKKLGEMGHGGGAECRHHDGNRGCGLGGPASISKANGAWPDLLQEVAANEVVRDMACPELRISRFGGTEPVKTEMELRKQIGDTFWFI